MAIILVVPVDLIHEHVCKLNNILVSEHVSFREFLQNKGIDLPKTTVGLKETYAAIAHFLHKPNGYRSIGKTRSTLMSAITTVSQYFYYNPPPLKRSAVGIAVMKELTAIKNKLSKTINLLAHKERLKITHISLRYNEPDTYVFILSTEFAEDTLFTY